MTFIEQDRWVILDAVSRVFDLTALVFEENDCPWEESLVERPTDI